MAKTATNVLKEISPALYMIGGGGVGLLVSGLLPAAIAPYAPAAGVALSGLAGPGKWGTYLVPSAVLGGVTFLSYRPTVQAAAGALVAARRTLTGQTAPAPASAPNETGDSPDEIRARADEIRRQAAAEEQLQFGNMLSPTTGGPAGRIGARAMAQRILDEHGL